MIDTRYIMKKYNIRPVKSLGQNFLTDEQIINQIVDAAQIKNTDIVIEIGPGLGTMTAEIAKRAGKVIAVEIDKHLMKPLEESLSEFSNVRILNKDILKVDFRTEFPEIAESTGNKADKPESMPSGLKVVANLPYYITTPVIMGLLEQGVPADMMVFMVQKEVADRMAANPGGKDYGSLSVAVQYFSKPTKVFEVPPHCFIPQPAVNSTVIRLDIYKNPPVSLLDQELFFKTVRASFGQRRKTLVNALFNSGYFNMDKDEVKETLRNVGIGENQRGETLSIMQFADLSNLIFTKK
jgi:16S rRNA (adenine1518-N6/adenine1519-N6)-dimethyltransferase